MVREIRLMTDQFLLLNNPEPQGTDWRSPWDSQDSSVLLTVLRGSHARLYHNMKQRQTVLQKDSQEVLPWHPWQDLLHRRSLWDVYMIQRGEAVKILPVQLLLLILPELTPGSRWLLFCRLFSSVWILWGLEKTCNVIYSVWFYYIKMLTSE